MHQPFAGKTAVVTGASRGIGRAVSERFAEQGANVVITYRERADEAESVVRRIREAGGEAIAVQADAGRLADIDRLIDTALAAFGRIDILVNNAGLMITKPLDAFTPDDYDRLFDANVKGTFFACQRAARHMAEGGRIVNVSTSVIGGMFPQYSLYAATKGAVEQLTRQLAKELGPKGITINAVAPGPVGTELFLSGKSEAQVEAIVRTNAFGRLADPDDVAGAFLFLASEEARWITGQTYRVNGGFV